MKGLQRTLCFGTNNRSCVWYLGFFTRKRQPTALNLLDLVKRSV